MRFPALIAALALAAAAATQAQTDRREVGPHEHGAGTLTIAIEGSRISMELSAPASDILGFEHEPTTAEQKQVLEKASASLARPLELFAFPAAAGCSVASANVVFNAGEPTDAKAAEAKPTHADFDIDYVLTCKSPDRIDALTFPYFKRFAGAQKLTVTVVSDKGQGQFGVTRDAPSLALR